jgi:type I restriction-modification system DNA methylase subunit
MLSASQHFLRDLDKKLWSAADRLRANLDAAVYKHAVLGLIFLKYVSDSFESRRQELMLRFADEKDDFFLGTERSADVVREELEERDYYIEKNVFWVPALARWKTLQDSAPLPPGTEFEITNGKKTTYKITSIGKLIDDALDAVEKENPKLKNVLDKRYAQLQLPPESLIGLINLIATIPFEHADLHAKDILGHVYEYFLGQFALAEGKKGGQYFTPKSIVSLIVEMLEPYQGRVYNPAMGSGGFFVQSERFIEEHGGKLGNLPGQLFTNTQIPACIWFLTKSKKARTIPAGDDVPACYRDRSREVLFIDARKLGFMKDRVLRDFTEEDIERIAGTINQWRLDLGQLLTEADKRGIVYELAPPYGDVSGFCKSATLEEIAAHGFVLGNR